MDTKVQSLSEFIKNTGELKLAVNKIVKDKKEELISKIT